MRDCLWFDEKQRSAFEGGVARAVQFIQDNQLTDRVLWKRFVQQFIDRSDSENGGWRGEYWGKMMRGASFVYSYTRDAELYGVLVETVEDLLRTQDNLGRIATYTPSAEFFGWDMWCRKYVLLGLQYFLEICEDPDLTRRVISAMCRHADYICDKVGTEPGKMGIFDTTPMWDGLPAATILEPMVRLYNLTGEQRYLDFAAYLADCGGVCHGDVVALALADELAAYQYPVTKAYEMMSFFEGLIEYYRVTGIEKYRSAALAFARRVMDTDITIIGSAGCTEELFDHSAVRQYDPASLSAGVMQETCVTVTWMKFCWQLLRLSGDAAFADCIEQSLYNAYLGAINTEGVIDQTNVKREDVLAQPLCFDSYSPLLPDTRGKLTGGFQIMRDKHYYGCCACIGSAGIGIAYKTAVMCMQDGIAVNLYIPGTSEFCTPDGNPARLKILTGYPADGAVSISLSLQTPETFSLLFRIPGWCKNATVTVAGEKRAVASGYDTICRQWHDGDEIQLFFDMPIRSLLGQGHIAFCRGPLVLAADMRLGRAPDEPISPLLQDGIAAGRILPASAVPFETTLAVALPTAEDDIILVDYASAGKTYRQDSRMAAWLPLKS